MVGGGKGERALLASMTGRRAKNVGSPLSTLAGNHLVLFFSW